MNRFLYTSLLIILFSTVFSSCLPEPEDQPDIFKEFLADLVEIRTYIAANNITNVDSLNSGLFYIIEREDNDRYAERRGLVTTNIRTSTLGGEPFINTFNSEENFTFIYEESPILPAIKQAMGLIGETGIITLFAPSILAYKDIGFKPYVQPYQPVMIRLEVVKITNPPVRD
jgi:hypothetical protein